MIENDISVSTLVIGGVVAAVGWGLKEVAKALISTLVKTMGKVEMLDAKFAEILKAMALFPKMQGDLNEYYSRLKKIEEKFNTPTQ